MNMDMCAECIIGPAQLYSLVFECRKSCDRMVHYCRGISICGMMTKRLQAKKL